MRIGLIAAGGFTYISGWSAIALARGAALNPPHWMLHGTPADVPTNGMWSLFALTIIPGAVLIFLGMVLQTNPRYRWLDTLLAIAGLVILLGSSTVYVYR